MIVFKRKIREINNCNFRLGYCSAKLIVKHDRKTEYWIRTGVKVRRISD